MYSDKKHVVDKYQSCTLLSLMLELNWEKVGSKRKLIRPNLASPLSYIFFLYPLSHTRSCTYVYIPAWLAMQKRVRHPVTVGNLGTRTPSRLWLARRTWIRQTPTPDANVLIRFWPRQTNVHKGITLIAALRLRCSCRWYRPYGYASAENNWVAL